MLNEIVRARRTVPKQNRVTPRGEIVAIPERGTFMGNRGCLHNFARTNPAVVATHALDRVRPGVQKVANGM